LFHPDPIEVEAPKLILLSVSTPDTLINYFYYSLLVRTSY